VLLDIAAVRGRWLESGEGIMPEDLDAAEMAAGVRVEPGDLLLLARAINGRRLAHGPRHPLKAASPAAHVACTPWFRERGIAMLGTTPQRRSPTTHPRSAIPCTSRARRHGPWLIDNCNLEDLARTCASLRRWEFMLAIGRSG